MRWFVLLLTLTACVQTPAAGGYRMQTGMIVSSSLEVLWRDDMRASDFQFRSIWFAPLDIDVQSRGQYGRTSRIDFQAMAEAYSEVMKRDLADRFVLADGPGRDVLTVNATVADIVHSEQLRIAGDGTFRFGPTGGTGEAVLILQFCAGDHVLAELASRMTGPRLDRGLHGRLGREDLARAFEPFAMRMHTSMVQTSG